MLGVRWGVKNHQTGISLHLNAPLLHIQIIIALLQLKKMKGKQRLLFLKFQTTSISVAQIIIVFRRLYSLNTSIDIIAKLNFHKKTLLFPF